MSIIKHISYMIYISDDDNSISIYVFSFLFRRINKINKYSSKIRMVIDNMSLNFIDTHVWKCDIFMKYVLISKIFYNI